MRVSGDSLETGDLELDMDARIFQAAMDQDAEYMKYLRDLAYTDWEAKHPSEEERAKYPFCEECFEGHDASKITCEEVQMMIDADREIAKGM